MTQSNDAKDAARYRWLVANSFDRETGTYFQVWRHAWAPHGSGDGTLTQWKQRIRGPALDGAIDDAMREQAARLAEPSRKE